MITVSFVFRDTDTLSSPVRGQWLDNRPADLPRTKEGDGDGEKEGRGGWGGGGEMRQNELPCLILQVSTEQSARYFFRA